MSLLLQAHFWSRACRRRPSHAIHPFSGEMRTRRLAGGRVCDYVRRSVRRVGAHRMAWGWCSTCSVAVNNGEGVGAVLRGVVGRSGAGSQTLVAGSGARGRSIIQCGPGPGGQRPGNCMRWDASATAARLQDADTEMGGNATAVLARSAARDSTARSHWRPRATGLRQQGGEEEPRCLTRRPRWWCCCSGPCFRAGFGPVFLRARTRTWDSKIAPVVALAAVLRASGCAAAAAV